MNIFKKLKPVDYVIILSVVLLVLIGVFVFSKKKNFSNLPVEKEAKINFDVFFRGVTISADEAPFKTDGSAFITIRNIPYKKLKITGVNGRRRMTLIPFNNEKGYIFIEDVSMPDLYDFLVRLEDTAKKTSDGYVIGGNKIKMGIPIVIEGEKYKYTGTVSNIYEVEEI